MAWRWMVVLSNNTKEGMIYGSRDDVVCFIIIKANSFCQRDLGIITLNVFICVHLESEVIDAAIRH